MTSGGGCDMKKLATLAACVVAAAFAAGPAPALDDAKQVFTGGNSGSGPSTRYSAPGIGNIYPIDFPSTGKGDAAAQIRMPAGTLSDLRVRVQTEGTATTGSVTVKLRVNGVDTTMSCSLGINGGSC